MSKSRTVVTEWPTEESVAANASCCPLKEDRRLQKHVDPRGMLAEYVPGSISMSTAQVPRPKLVARLGSERVSKRVHSPQPNDLKMASVSRISAMFFPTGFRTAMWSESDPANPLRRRQEHRPVSGPGEV